MELKPTSEILESIKLPVRSNVLPRIDLSITPYLIEPLNCIGDGETDMVFLIGPTQSGKTVFAQAAIANAILQAPGTLAYMLPDEKSGKRQLEEKVLSVIRETPEMRCKVKQPEYDNLNKTVINLETMTIYPMWSGSIANTSSVPCRYVVWDEIRLMALTVGGESNCIKAGEDRMTTYRAMGMAQGIGVSTPSTQGDLLHQQMSVPGTVVLYLHHQCKNCYTHQIIDFFSQHRVRDGKVEIFCSHCNTAFDGSDRKRKFNENAVYAPKGAKIYKDGTLEGGKIVSKRKVYRFDSLASPFRDFQAIYDEYIKTKDKLHDYKNFFQAWLARFWVNDVSKTNQNQLKSRRANYISGTVRKGCKLLTCGVDTQGDGFCCTVRGWFSDGHTDLVESLFIESDKYKDVPEVVERKLREQLMERVYIAEDGERWIIGLGCIDRGGNRTNQLTEALQGIPNLIGVNGRNTTQYQTIRLYNGKIYVRTEEYLDETEIKCTLETFHLPMNVSEDYIQQFLNARKVEDRNNKTGNIKTIWKKTGKNDYRMADVHAFLALDIDTEDFGTFRRRLEIPDFKYNPYESLQYCRSAAPEAVSVVDQREHDYLPSDELNWF